MGTPAITQFTYGDKVEAAIYTHWDGYGIDAELQEFFGEVEKQTKDTRFDDPTYLAAKFVVWYAGHRASPTPGSLDFLGIGVTTPDHTEGYTWRVDCAGRDGQGRPLVKRVR